MCLPTRLFISISLNFSKLVLLIRLSLVLVSIFIARCAARTFKFLVVLDSKAF